MRFKKKEGGSVLFKDPDKAAEVRRNLREGVARAVRPQMEAIDKWLREDSKRLPEFWI